MNNLSLYNYTKIIIFYLPTNTILMIERGYAKKEDLKLEYKIIQAIPQSKMFIISDFKCFF